ncbi:MAG TPA: hypothetical protein VMB48_15070 [Steroidobacteraceae bacterium]|nr:hypothetical protein [Steroidobacteraceae bacterium]
MTNDTASTRRMFLQGGALLAAPIAAAAVPAAALAGPADHALRARLARLEDEAAIRGLHQSWLRRVNAGECGALPEAAVRRIIADHAGAPDRVEIAADGRTAIGRFDHAVELETLLAGDCTLAQMAHAQGTGTVRRTERRLLVIDYRKAGGGWSMEQVALQAL